jgi:Family of unknown function (DUF5670)
VASQLQFIERNRDSGGRYWEMLWTLVVILLVLWALGLAFKVASGLIHILLVVALVVIVFRLISGKRVV